MKRKTVIIILAIIAVVIGGVIWVGVRSAASPTTDVNTITADDHVAGSKEAKAVLIEYSDFQCPACKIYEPIVKQVREKYGDRLAIVYRQYPLRQTHKFSQVAAQAVEAASQQGKFWEFHDLLFDRQSSWSQAVDIELVLIGYAQELELDAVRFKNDMNSDQTKQEIQQDVDRGNRSRISGTPTFFFNGQKLLQPELKDFTDVIDAQLNK